MSVIQICFCVSTYKPAIGLVFLPGAVNARLWGFLMKRVLACFSLCLLFGCGSKSDQPSNLKGWDDGAKSSRWEKPLNNATPSSSLEENSRYPIRPDPTMTPGEVCDRPSEYRYPEKIKYCNRDVDKETKARIFIAYDRELGYHTTEMDRQQFKIDHLIPLCAGGGNREDNLWPQHQKVYQITDPIEPLLCQKMAAGRLKQQDAIKLIKEIKLAPDTTDARMDELEHM
jgi:hypothetical protein